jgi:phage tail-like protein
VPPINPISKQDAYNQAAQFRVAVDGLDVADFRECEGLTVQLDVVEYHEGGENTFHHKRVGPTKWSNIVLRRGTTDSLKFHEWINKTLNGEIERLNGSITALDRDNNTPVARWEFRNAWPCRYRGPDFSKTNRTEMAIEELELAHDGFKMVKG